MPLPPEDQEEAIELYSKILAKAGIPDEVRNVTVSRSGLGPGGQGQGDGSGDGLQLEGQTEFVTIQLNLLQDDELKEPVKKPTSFQRKKPEKAEDEEEDDDDSEEDEVNKEKVKRSPVLELFLKKRPTDPMKGILFEREVFFYSVFLPDAVAFSEERDEFKEVRLGQLFAKCYHADSDMILLENLEKKGLIMTPIDKHHTFLQAEMILENIGRFHAVTNAMIKTLGLENFKLKYPSLVEEVVFSADKAENEIHSKYWDTMLEMALAILKDKPVKGSDEGLQFLEKYKGKVFSELCELVKSRNEDVLTTLNFGDICNGNVFVKRDEKIQRYTAAVFIKPTMTRIGSPMLDVSCYMHSCVAEHIRLTNYKYLLDVFFEFIRDKSEEMGIDFEMDFEELKMLYIGKSCYGIFRGLDYLFTKQHRIPLELNGENFDLAKFGTWLKENPDRHKMLAQEIVSNIQQYELCLQELAQLE